MPLPAALRRLRCFFAAIAVLMLPIRAHAAETWSTWHTSAILNDRGVPVFTVDGKPFFVYGAAFFYERIPATEWRADLLRYRALGINTIDLYLIWNWHEPDRRTIDFGGRTNPRRNLRELFSIIHRLGFKAIVRPGPVIRNEWRNGGYPAWLLEQRAYGMPLHDVLEGRYPATATFQNAHADAAAEEWLGNATHLRAAASWLHGVLQAIEPWSHDVIAIALDDDQGAYLDNDTWPAPHWHAYMSWLERQVRGVVGSRVPLFINTYQMKVTASAPVWAWGNWYQSDAYRIGSHDLSDLAFSFGLLQTQRSVPIMSSEFQAGWLQGAAEIAPRPAAPENTTLALHEMLHMGVHGVVNFPVQDTIDPAGWEVPWANWSYAWDAAYNDEMLPSARFLPTAAFGSVVRGLGSFIARSHPVTDVQIAWLPSSYDPRQMTNERFAQLAGVTVAQQRRCRALALTCRLVDLRFDSLQQLTATPWLVVPCTGLHLRRDASFARILRRLSTRVHIVASVDDARHHGAHSSTGGITDATLLEGDDGAEELLDIFNAQTSQRSIPATTLMLDGKPIRFSGTVLPPGGAADFLIRPSGVTPLRFAVPKAAATTIAPKPTGDGSPWFTLQNFRARVLVAADAGARAFVFQTRGTHRNLFTTIGAGRDDVQNPPAPSSRDYIARYTHPIQAGTFNRSYACKQLSPASVGCTYVAPDLRASPVRFEKRYTLEPDGKLVMMLRSSAPACSVSAVLPGVRVVADGGATVRRQARSGFTIVRVRYPAGRSIRVTFSPQGALSTGANRP
jgi:hypothetical protein